MTTRLCMSLDLHLTRQNWLRKTIQYNTRDGTLGTLLSLEPEIDKQQLAILPQLIIYVNSRALKHRLLAQPKNYTEALSLNPQRQQGNLTSPAVFGKANLKNSPINHVRLKWVSYTNASSPSIRCTSQ